MGSLGPLDAVLGVFGGQSGAPLAVSRAVLGLSWATWESWNQLEALAGPFGAAWGRSRQHLGPSWTLVGPKRRQCQNHRKTRRNERFWPPKGLMGECREHYKSPVRESPDQKRAKCDSDSMRTDHGAKASFGEAPAFPGIGSPCRCFAPHPQDPDVRCRDFFDAQSQEVRKSRRPPQGRFFVLNLFVDGPGARRRPAEAASVEKPPVATFWRREI